MKAKKICSLALALLMAVGVFMTPAFAVSFDGQEIEILPLEASEDTITPRWNNISAIHSSLTVSGNTLYPDATIVAQDSDATITGTMYLEEEVGTDDWDSVRSWSIYGTGSASREGLYSGGNSGSTYRVRVKVNVGGEEATAYSNEVEL